MTDAKTITNLRGALEHLRDFMNETGAMSINRCPKCEWHEDSDSFDDECPRCEFSCKEFFSKEHEGEEAEVKAESNYDEKTTIANLRSAIETLRLLLNNEGAVFINRCPECEWHEESETFTDICPRCKLSCKAMFNREDEGDDEGDASEEEEQQTKPPPPLPKCIKTVTPSFDRNDEAKEAHANYETHCKNFLASATMLNKVQGQEALKKITNLRSTVNHLRKFIHGSGDVYINRCPNCEWHDDSEKFTDICPRCETSCKASFDKGDDEEDEEEPQPPLAKRAKSEEY